MHVPALRFGGQLRELTLSACASLKLLCQRVRDGARPYVVKKWGAFFIFLAKNHSKKTIQMKSSESIFCKKWAFFRFLAEKIFSVAAREVARRWSARTAARRGIGLCELLRGVPGGFGVRVDGRSWASVDGRSWARVDGRDGGCACLI